MLAPAAPRRPAGWTGPVLVELPLDVRPPLDVLAYWMNTWRAYAEQPTALGPTMERACDYLDAQLHRIAATPHFLAMAKDLARVVSQLETVLHAGVRPDVSDVPCLSCGTPLHKVWTEDADHDHYRCPVCGEVYDHKRFEVAKHHHLTSSGADRFVPLVQAVAAIGRPEQTVRGWVRDGLVNTRLSVSGRREVWWPDVRDRHRTTPLRSRRMG